MAKSAEKRFTTAEGRLRRMEALIRPYSDNTVAFTPRDKEEWIPGDHVHVKRSELTSGGKFSRIHAK